MSSLSNFILHPIRKHIETNVECTNSKKKYADEFNSKQNFNLIYGRLRFNLQREIFKEVVKVANIYELSKEILSECLHL